MHIEKEGKTEIFKYKYKGLIYILYNIYGI